MRPIPACATICGAKVLFKRILLTGGSGQVGTAVQALAPADVSVHAPPSAQLDVSDGPSVAAAFAEFRPHAVINAAAYTRVDQAEDEPDAAYAANAEGARHIAAACAANDCPLLHLSTDYVFDGAKPGPYVESDPTVPINAYGRSKLAGERAVAEVLDTHVILRVSWVFSATGVNFVKTMLNLAGRDELRVVNDQRGAPTAARSIAAALWRILERMAATPRFGLYHFTSAPPTTWHGFATAIFAGLAEQEGRDAMPELIPIPTAEYPTPAARPANSLLDGTRLQQHYGIGPADWRGELGKVLAALAPKGVA